MPAARQIAALDQIAVGEQHRSFGVVGLDARGVDRHHVRAVGKVSDAAEAFGLALRAIGAAGAIEPHELRVGGRIDRWSRSRAGTRRCGGCAIVRLSGVATYASVGKRRAVDRDCGAATSSSPSSTQGRRAVGGRIGPQRQARAHARGGRMQRRCRDRPCRPASRADGNPAGGRGGLVQCAWLLIGLAALPRQEQVFHSFSRGSAWPIDALDRRPFGAQRALQIVDLLVHLMHGF